MCNCVVFVGAGFQVTSLRVRLTVTVCCGCLVLWMCCTSVRQNRHTVAPPKYTPPLFVTRWFHLHTAPHISALSWYEPHTAPLLEEVVHQQCSSFVSGFQYSSGLSHERVGENFFSKASLADCSFYTRFLFPVDMNIKTVGESVLPEDPRRTGTLPADTIAQNISQWLFISRDHFNIFHLILQLAVCWC